MSGLFLWFGLLFSPLCHHHGIMVTILRREARDTALLSHHLASLDESVNGCFATIFVHF